MHPIRLFACKTVTSTLVQMSAKLRLNFFYYAGLQCMDYGVIYKIFRSATIKIEMFRRLNNKLNKRKRTKPILGATHMRTLLLYMH